MILILGGDQSGRHAFFATLGIDGADCAEVTAHDAQAFASEAAVAAEQGKRFCAPLSAVCARLSSYRAVIATERGMGIIPLDAADRAAREANGRLNIALASLSDCVVLVIAGIPRVIKGDLEAARAARPLFMAVFRHGATEANLARRYAGGGTDLALSCEGRAQAAAYRAALSDYAAGFSPAVRAALLAPALVYVSPMRRCVETASLLFPDAEQRVVADFCEMHFGLFENRTARELLADPATKDAYQAFVASGGSLPCPPSPADAGESVAQFMRRTARAFESLVHGENSVRTKAAAAGSVAHGAPESASPRVIVIVAHGGTQMALFSQFCAWQLEQGAVGSGSSSAAGAAVPLSYYAWQTECAGLRFGACGERCL